MIQQLGKFEPSQLSSFHDQSRHTLVRNLERWGFMGTRDIFIIIQQ